eukprot:4353129-Alexandrium_andersonii.AAC.1
MVPAPFYELSQRSWHLCTGSAKGPGTFVRAQPKVLAPLAELSQRPWHLGLSSAKGPGTCVRALPK